MIKPFTQEKQKNITIKIVDKIIKLSINIISYPISLFIKRDPKIWIFGGWFGGRFADNSKHFYLYVHQKTDTRAIWITRKAEIANMINNELQGEAYLAWSPKGIWLSLKALVHVIDQSSFDINPWTSSSAICINLWHGLPLKRIGSFCKNIQRRGGLEKSLRKILSKWVNPIGWQKGKYYLLTTSPLFSSVLGTAFDVPEKQCLECGYPRNDALVNSFENPFNDVSINSVVHKKNEGKILVGYFPTFRDSRIDVPWGTENQNELEKLCNYLEEKNIVVITKNHFAETKYANFNLPHHVNLRPEEDIYDVLPYIDILITDYSSIYFDFLLLNRPIILYQYDLEYYKNHDRGLIDGHEKLFISSVATTIDSLVSELDIAIKNRNYCLEEREKIKRISFSHPDEHSSERLYLAITDIIDKKLGIKSN